VSQELRLLWRLLGGIVLLISLGGRISVSEKPTFSYGFVNFKWARKIGQALAFCGESWNNFFVNPTHVFLLLSLLTIQSLNMETPLAKYFP